MSTDAGAWGTLSLAGRVAVVTGHASGIGAAAAELMKARGAVIVGVDIAEDTGAGLVDVSVHADLSREDECGRVAEIVRTAFGRVDILVNNAGIGGFGLSLQTSTHADWERIVGVNAASVFLLTRALLPSLRAGTDPVVVSVGSVHALATAAGVAPYAASKGAVAALTRAMAIDLAPEGIRAVGVLPGATDTPMLRSQAEREGRSYDELGFHTGPGAFPRVCAPTELAEVIAFLSSRAARAINGSNIVADGGLLAQL